MALKSLNYFPSVNAMMQFLKTSDFLVIKKIVFFTDISRGKVSVLVIYVFDMEIKTNIFVKKVNLFRKLLTL